MRVKLHFAPGEAWDVSEMVPLGSLSQIRVWLDGGVMRGRGSLALLNPTPDPSFRKNLRRPALVGFYDEEDNLLGLFYYNPTKLRYNPETREYTLSLTGLLEAAEEFLHRDLWFNNLDFPSLLSTLQEFTGRYIDLPVALHPGSKPPFQEDPAAPDPDYPDFFGFIQATSQIIGYRGPITYRTPSGGYAEREYSVVGLFAYDYYAGALWTLCSVLGDSYSEEMGDYALPCIIKWEWDPDKVGWRPTLAVDWNYLYLNAPAPWRPVYLGHLKPDYVVAHTGPVATIRAGDDGSGGVVLGAMWVEAEGLRPKEAGYEGVWVRRVALSGDFEVLFDSRYRLWDEASGHYPLAVFLTSRRHGQRPGQLVFGAAMVVGTKEASPYLRLRTDVWRVWDGAPDSTGFTIEDLENPSPTRWYTSFWIHERPVVEQTDPSTWQLAWGVAEKGEPEAKGRLSQQDWRLDPGSEELLASYTLEFELGNYQGASPALLGVIPTRPRWVSDPEGDKMAMVGVAYYGLFEGTRTKGCWALGVYSDQLSRVGDTPPTYRDTVSLSPDPEKDPFFDEVQGDALRDKIGGEATYSDRVFRTGRLKTILYPRITHGEGLSSLLLVLHWDAENIRVFALSQKLRDTGPWFADMTGEETQVAPLVYSAKFPKALSDVRPIPEPEPLLCQWEVDGHRVFLLSLPMVEKLCEKEPTVEPGRVGDIWTKAKKARNYNWAVYTAQRVFYITPLAYWSVANPKPDYRKGGHLKLLGKAWDSCVHGVAYAPWDGALRLVLVPRLPLKEDEYWFTYEYPFSPDGVGLRELEVGFLGRYFDSLVLGPQGGGIYTNIWWDEEAQMQSELLVRIEEINPAWFGVAAHRAKVYADLFAWLRENHPLGGEGVRIGLYEILVPALGLTPKLAVGYLTREDLISHLSGHDPELAEAEWQPTYWRLEELRVSLPKGVALMRYRAVAWEVE